MRLHRGTVLKPSLVQHAFVAEFLGHAQRRREPLINKWSVREQLERFAIEFIDVASDLIDARPAKHVVTKYLEGPLGRSAARVKEDQHAGDQCGVDLDLDAILLGAQQVPTTQQLFEHPEEDFNLPITIPPKQGTFIGRLT